MTQRVDIVLPSGEQATVPQADLAQALAAGATRPAPAASTADGGGLLGALATGVIGAGSTATFGMSDRLLSEGSDFADELSPGLHKETLSTLRQAREANPYSALAGEGAGLLLNPGGVTGAGEAAEGAVAARLGEGLLGKAASMGARGATEGAIMGAQHQVTEDALGDHGYNGEAIFASAAKDALIGGAAGAFLGVGSHVLGEATGLLRRSPGPAADAALDEVAGVPGAGRKLAAESRAAETTVEDLRKTGLTSEQAAQAVDEISNAAKERAVQAADEVSFVPHPNTGKSHTTVMVDTSALDRAWQKDVGFYIGPGEEGIPGRRAGVEQFLTKGEPLQASRVTVDKDGRAVFTDGRHRFSTLRDKGIDRVAITVPKADLKRLPPEWNVGPLNAPRAAGAAGGPVSGAIDGAVERYVAAQAGSNPERAQVIRQAYANSQRKLSEVEGTIENHALKMSEKGTKVLRNLEDVVNEVQFTEKPQQFAKLVDPSKASIQRDAVAALLQDSDDVLREWEQTASRGGAGRDITSLRKAHTDALHALAKVEDAGGEMMGRDLMIKTDKLKRLFDRSLQWGRENRYGLPEAIGAQQIGLEALTKRMRSTLEDEAIWGKAGPAQARWNGSFSLAKARRDHFMSELGVSIDQKAGIRIPEVDFKKVRGMLNELKGGEADAALQSVKSTEAAISGFRDRVAAIREFGDLTEAQSAKLTEGMKDLAEFEAAFKSARKDSAVANRLKEAALEERNAGNLGGLIGLAGSVVTQPLTTVQRLARVRQTVQKTEEAIAGGLRRFFGGDADTAATKIAEKLAPREKAVVAKEIGDISELRGNPLAMQERATRMVGDLGNFAPKIAREVELTAIRALDYLAREAPKPSVSFGLLGLHKSKPRYSDQQISDWESKRKAAFDPESVVRDMKQGRLNRDAIQTVEIVSPKLFAKMQELARDQIEKLEADGKLDKMPYQQKAVISTLLKTPADRTWEPDFISMMQAAKAAPAPQAAPKGPPQPNTGVSKRAVKINTDIFATESQGIEQGGAA